MEQYSFLFEGDRRKRYLFSRKDSGNPNLKDVTLNRGAILSNSNTEINIEDLE
jgi:hypothetical protein